MTLDVLIKILIAVVLLAAWVVLLLKRSELLLWGEGVQTIALAASDLDEQLKGEPEELALACRRLRKKPGGGADPVTGMGRAYIAAGEKTGLTEEL